jgi:tetratricopeptide (TPR) repeat protein
MPSTSVADADHVVYTDHSIPRRPAPRNLKPPADAPLRPFGIEDENPRDLGLAYAIVALRENSAAYRQRAFELLREANAQAPDEPQTLAYLADFYKARSDDKTARPLYERLVRIDPAQSAAWAALGAYEMEAGHAEEAIRLWREALKISPALVLVRYNLALALVKTGHKDEARAMVEKALEFNPSFAAARRLLDELARGR